MKHLANLWPHLDRRRRWQIGALCLLILVSSFAELVSLGAVMPFLAVMVAPERVFESAATQPIIQALDITSAQSLLLPLACIFALASLTSAAIRMLLLWVMTRLAFAIGADISFSIYNRALHQPYATHVARNSSETISGITVKSHAVIYGGLLPALQLASAIVTLVVIVAGSRNS